MSVGRLTPNNKVSLDCGSQQTFTCIVTGGAAAWTITGLTGITVVESSGLITAASIPGLLLLTQVVSLKSQPSLSLGLLQQTM